MAKVLRTLQAEEPGDRRGVDPARLRPALLAWYDRHGRDLPWRVRRAPPDPYRVWLSEIMLQQTAVATVIPYFERFVERWPSLPDLAGADLDQVLHAWQGLGYYGRAHRLHECARVVRDTLGGRFPQTEPALRALPGIGPYTAAAIAAIAFDRPAVPVDGNVERVLARLFAVEVPLPAAKPALRQLAGEFAAADRAGDCAQALMDLGATVCVPRNPRCGRCPWHGSCQGRIRGRPETLPRRAPRPERPQRFAAAFIIADGNGALFLERRPGRGLLGGLMQVPLTAWLDQPPDATEAARLAPFAASWRPVPGIVKHGFTHFAARLTLVAARIDRRRAPALEGVWCTLEGLDGVALSTMMKKIIRHAERQGALGGGRLPAT